MKTKSLTKHDFDVLLIPCIERMIAKEESHLKNIQNNLNNLGFLSFIGVKKQLLSMAESSKDMLTHLNFRLKEYKQYAKNLKS